MKKKHYPDKVKVRRKHYKLHLSPVIEDDKGQDMALYGYCVPEDRCIIINTSYNEAEMFKTFWHEVLHAIEAEYKLKMPHKLVYALEGALAKFIKDNFNIRFKRR